MKWIKMPRQISLSRPSSIINIIGEIKSDVFLDWQNVELIMPSGHAILTCLLDSIREKGLSVQSKNIKEKFLKIPVVNLLKRDLSKKILSPKLTDISDSHFLLRGFDTVYPMGLVDVFKSKCPGFLANEDLEYECNLILSELIQNTIDHSTGERFYIVIAGTKKEIMICVLDMGVTIPAKLRQKYSTDSDIESLELSMKLDITTRRQRPGGKGLYYTLNALRDSKGKLTIVSGDGQIKRYFSDRTIKRTKIKNKLFGTWVFVQFPNRKK